MKNIIALFFVIFFFSKINAQEKKKIEADKKASSIMYAMKHPLHDWDATSKDSKCVIVYNTTTQKIEAVAVIAPVKSFDSGNSNRDSHTIEVLDALKFPNITFSASNIQDNGSSLIIKGNLIFHGVTKPIELKASKSISKSNLKIEGSFVVNMKDFGVEPPGLMGVKTEEKINLNYNMVFGL